MHMDLAARPYATWRTPMIASNGMVATSHPLAAQAGLTILRKGGSAVDAAIATAAALTVLEPTSNGIGGDAFALVWDRGRLYGLNGSGRAPGELTRERVLREGNEKIPDSGWLSVTVPGAPALWADLHARFGRLSFAETLEPAIRYAEDGHPVAPNIARTWATAVHAAHGRHEPQFTGFLPTFALNGMAPLAGTTFRSAGHARTLRQIAQTNARAFYEGEIAHAIATFARETGGLLSDKDLAVHQSTWVEPLGINYHNHTVWEIPPNGQGLAALLGLGILDGIDLGRYPRDSAEAYHAQIEAMKLAFADAYRYIADPSHTHVPTEDLLNPAYLAERRKLMSERARAPDPGMPPKGGTVYLCTADRDGQMVSLIQSNYSGFGSGIVVPGWGIALQNRGSAFSLDPAHPNVVAPHKRPFHTIIPAFLTQGTRPVGPFGVMGAEMQPQGHMQVVVNTLHYGMNPQAALDAPRWRVEPDQVQLELNTPRHVIEGLVARGHHVRIEAEPSGFGRGQIIWQLETGAYVAGTEARCDGSVAGW